MKALACFDERGFDILRWFEIDNCVKFISGNLTRNSIVVVDEKLYIELKETDILKNCDVVVFGSQTEFEDVTNCKDWSALGQKLLQNPKQKSFVLNGSEVFDKLLPFCSAKTVGYFNLQKKTNYMNILNGGGGWTKLSEMDSPLGCKLVGYQNVYAIPPLMMKVKDDLQKEDQCKKIMSRIKSSKQASNIKKEETKKEKVQSENTLK